jgi:hypothetical protein
MGKVENRIKIAKMTLDPNNKTWDDLDCAALGLQQTLIEDPENAAAAELLKEIIAEIDRRFDAGDDRGTECHFIGGWESPSPYVRAKEHAAGHRVKK